VEHKQQLGAELLKRSRSLINAAVSGNWEIGELESLTKEEVVQPMLYRKVNLLHIAAEASQLKHFPKKHFYREGLLEENAVGETVLHLAASKGELGFIPKELLDKTNLFKENREGNSVIHYAALSGDLTLIDQDLLTSAILSKKNKYGNSPLDFAIFGSEGYATNKKLNRSAKKNKKVIGVIISKLCREDLIKEIKPQKNELNTLKNEYIKKELEKRELKARVFDQSSLDPLCL